MRNPRLVACMLVSVLPLSSFAAPRQSGQAADRSRVHQSVTGPTHTMNEALAGGATATITLQPVAPKTVPASDYPPGTVIMNETIYLGSVPARVWLEAHITGWAPEILRTFLVTIDATDEDGDGGGYSGDLADCDGEPAVGAGDLFPAIVPCSASGICQGNPSVACSFNSECGANGPCINVHATCRAEISGRTSDCAWGEPSRCGPRPAFFPSGGTVCQHVFFDGCDPEFALAGLAAFPKVDMSSLNIRFGWTLNSANHVSALDFGPSYTGTLVLDVPANARGRYVIDVNESEKETFMHNVEDYIPIAMIKLAVIAVDTCSSHVDCDDGDVCTMDSCQGGCCERDPIAGWDPDTECCNPVSGVQAPIPQSTSCRTGTCTLGGSSGSPTYTNLPDGTSCTAVDPCYLDGLCGSGQCFGEQYEGSDCPKPRFISFDVGSGPARAYRVRLASLHHPDPPYTGGTVTDFSAYEGEVRWVGPHSTYAESSADPSPVYASLVQCMPHYQNWSFDLLHVTGAEIVPSSVYEVQSIEEGLDVKIESNYSDPIIIHTGRWGDVAHPYSPPVTTAQPNLGDHAALTTKFRSTPGAMSKPRALLVGTGMSGIPNLTLDLSFAHIAASVDAFRGSPYPYAGPQPCP